MRIGLLAASNISVRAIVEPASVLDNVDVAAVAARSLDKAGEFAFAHGVPKAYGSYDDLLSDTSLDAIYIGTPNSLHSHWAIKALEAGHNVLCEKPIAGNAADARRMAAAAETTGLVLMEAFHWRFHRFADRMIERISRLHRPVEIEAVFNVPGVPKDNIRYQHHLGGGALMDLGCYPVHWIRTLLGEPVRIEAEMDTTIPGVDDTTRAELLFEDGSIGHVTSSMVSAELTWYLRATAGNGRVRAENPLAPQDGNLLEWDIDGSQDSEEVGGPSSYEAQLTAFTATVAGETAPLVELQDSINNMAVIDEIYRRAGLDPRP